MRQYVILVVPINVGTNGKVYAFNYIFYSIAKELQTKGKHIIMKKMSYKTKRVFSLPCFSN